MVVSGQPVTRTIKLDVIWISITFDFHSAIFLELQLINVV
jgi:hypothetical protein